MGEDDMAFENGLVCETPACMQGMAIADMSKYRPQNMHLNNLQFHKQIDSVNQVL